MNGDPKMPKNCSSGCPGCTQGSFISQPQTISSQKADQSPTTSDLSYRSCGLSVLSIFVLFFFFLVIATFLPLMSQNAERMGSNSI